MLARNEPPDDDDERFYQQACKVHRAVYAQIEKHLWDGLSVINEVDRDAAFSGTVTALLQQALWMRALGQALTNAPRRDADEDREDFVRLAGDSWADANREDE